MRPLKDGQKLLLFIKHSGMRIVACNMGRQGSVGAFIGIEHKRDMARIGCVVVGADKNAERIRADQVMENTNVSDLKTIGNEHGLVLICAGG